MTGNNPPEPAPAPLEHIVRLLYPFWLEVGQLDGPTEALCQLRHRGRKQAEKTTWQEANVPTLYREEILPLVADVLFGGRQGTHRYLRIDGETLNYWFPRDGLLAESVQTEEAGQAYPLKPAGEGIELFLSPHGVGLLSLSFQCRLGGLKYLQACTHRLSQLRSPTAYRYHVPLDAASDQTAPAPEEPFAQRLGSRGGAFLLAELVDFLLGPLEAFGLRETQQQFSVYAATRFDKHALFTEADCQARLRPFLAALAHVEEATHQGSLDLRERVLNPRHWAAVGSLGAAHLVADQDPSHPFDQQRMSRSLYKYFVPYLCATLQRLSLQRLLWETDRAVLAPTNGLRERQAKLCQLHQDMLRFSVQGCFTEVSSREVHNQYYELALQSLRVEQSLRLVQRVLHDLESAATAAFQQETSQDTQKLAREVGVNVGLLAEVQRKVEWLEVFFVSYYATALAHYIGEGLFAEAYAHWSVVAAPFVSGLLALWFIKPYAGHAAAAHGPEAEPAAAKATNSWVFLAAMSLLIAAWVGVGLGCFPKEKHAVEGASFLCANHSDCGRESAEGSI